MIEYEIVRSGRKTVAVEVQPGGKVLVRAPYRASRLRIDAVVLANENWILAQIARLAGESPVTEFSREEEEMLKRRAGDLLPDLVREYAARMGVQPAGVRITGAKTRYGSCSAQNRLCFSWRLFQYPREAVEAVVVHELAHIRHKNHSAAFYQEVEAVLPDYRERKKLLKGLWKTGELSGD